MNNKFDRVDMDEDNSEFEFTLDPKFMKMIDNLKIISPIVYSKWQTLPNFKWGPRPNLLKGNTSKEHVWIETNHYFSFGETSLA
jgi:hypothetical protein